MSWSPFLSIHVFKYVFYERNLEGENVSRFLFKIAHCVRRVTRCIVLLEWEVSIAKHSSYEW